LAANVRTALPTSRLALARELIIAIIASAIEVRVNFIG
jgi:hypothetical protein